MVTRPAVLRPARLLLCLGLFAFCACTQQKTATAPPAPVTNARRGASTSTLPSQLITPQDLATQPGGLETVRVAYTLLMDKYYKPLKSSDLLSAAWSGVIAEAGKEKNSESVDAPTLTGDRDADFKAFSASFNSVTAQGDKAQYGVAAVQAMARSLKDDHTSELGSDTIQRLDSAGSSSSPSQVFSTKMLPNGVGYMKLSSFPAGYQPLEGGKNLSQEIDDALNSFESQGVKGWILDLRNDGGGHTESISTVAGRFIPDGLQEIDVDGQGHRLETPFDGHYFPHPHPLAVLINGGSASASEITAEALKDYGAARIFGTRSAGAVNGAEIFPLPGQIGLEYTVVQVLAGKTDKPLDKVGVQPDDVVQAQPGKDAALDAAEAWIASPGTSAPKLSGKALADPSALKPDQLRSELSRYGADVKDMPPMSNLRLLGDVELDTPNEYAVWAACTTNAPNLERAVAARGWQGQYDQFFGSGDPFTYQVSIDLYKDQSGAQQAMSANDCPEGLQQASVPVRVGDESSAMKGAGVLLGWTELRWRRGRAVFTAYYYSEPGLESFDPLTQIAEAVDGRYEANPLK